MAFLPDGEIGGADVQNGENQKSRVEDAQSGQEGGEKIANPVKKNRKFL
jgi:hypothetical protein